MSKSNGVDTLRKPRRPLVTALVVAGVVVALSGGGVAAYAIGQAVLAPSAASEVTESPTPTAEPNLAPVAAITASVADLTVSVDGTTSSDEDGTVVEFAWDFGDGTTASESTATHTYAAPGSYTVALVVTDDAGSTGSAEYTATVASPPPPPPPAAVKCPAGSTANSNDGRNDTSCYPNICFTIPVPDPAHPECDQAFKP